MSNNILSGFVKRAQEHGLSQQDAVEIFKVAERSREDIADRLGNKGVGSAIYDYAPLGLGAAYGAHGAGKATALSKALGRDPSFDMNNPMTAMAIKGVLGSLGGQLAGGGIGHAIDNMQEANSPDEEVLRLPSNTLIGQGAGGFLGGFLGAAQSKYKRRSEHQRNVADYENGADIETEEPKNKGLLGSLLLPFSGYHRAGEAEGHRLLRGKSQGQGTSQTANALSNIPLANIPLGIIQNLRANEINHETTKRDRKSI